MRKSKFKEPKTVLIFNGAQVLIAIVRSLHSASKISGCNLQAISFCCTGKYISTGGFYFRHVDSNIEVEISDLDNLKLTEYDQMCGQSERRYYSIRTMAKKFMIHDNKRKNIINNGNS